jgi:hypothetical protein
MENRFEDLTCEDEVVSVDNSDKIIIEYPMFTVGQLLSKIKFLLKNYGGVSDPKMVTWFIDGQYCKLLKLGAKGWQKGKIRIRVSVEFCPDEPQTTLPESPLDDLRQMINQENQQ